MRHRTPCGESAIVAPHAVRCVGPVAAIVDESTSVGTNLTGNRRPHLTGLVVSHIGAVYNTALACLPPAIRHPPCRYTHLLGKGNEDATEKSYAAAPGLLPVVLGGCWEPGGRAFAKSVWQSHGPAVSAAYCRLGLGGSWRACIGYARYHSNRQDCRRRRWDMASPTTRARGRGPLAADGPRGK